MVDYERAPKRRFTRLLLDVASASGCRTFAGLWGTGGESRLAAAAGLKVLAVDNDPETFAAMTADGGRVGYETFSGNARLLRLHVDMWHADFMSTPNPDNLKTVRHLSHLADKWIAVTLSTDHMKNPEMQGDAIVATLPAWLTFAAEGFTLEYLSTYTRNELGLRMWTAILRRRSGHGNSHRVQPIQIAWAISHRGYWASAALHADFPGMLPHRTPFWSDDRAEYLKRHYAENRDALLDKSRAFYHAHAAEINARQRAKRAEADPEAREKARAYHREWRKRHPHTPEQAARREAYRRQYYMDHREEAIAAAAAHRRAKRKAEAG